jgi:hypothetical protein
MSTSRRQRAQLASLQGRPIALELSPAAEAAINGDTTTMTTHTPGPWAITPHAENGESWRTFYVGPTTGGHVAVVSSSNCNHPADEADANARLCAAAPAILDAARACLVDLDHYASTHGPGPDRRRDALRDAIEQATGQ